LHELVVMCLLINQSYVCLYVLVCMSMDLLCYCVVMTCGFLADVACVLYFAYLRFWYLSPLEQVLVGTPSHSCAPEDGCK
jgi:hypothetical protein